MTRSRLVRGHYPGDVTETNRTQAPKQQTAENWRSRTGTSQVQLIHTSERTGPLSGRLANSTIFDLNAIAKLSFTCIAGFGLFRCFAFIRRVSRGGGRCDVCERTPPPPLGPSGKNLLG